MGSQVCHCTACIVKLISCATMPFERLRYKKMFETRNMWPYYSIPHLGMGGIPFQQLVGFEYKRPINIVTAELFNEGWLEEDELEASTEYFREYWKDEDKVGNLFVAVKERLADAVRAEEYGAGQSWEHKSKEDLLRDMHFFYTLLFALMTDFIISQPQHVASLQEEIERLVTDDENKDDMIFSATFREGEFPWTEQDRVIERLNREWPVLPEDKRQDELASLVRRYGWFNTIEGDMSFDADHYRKLIEEYAPRSMKRPNGVVPSAVLKVGALIGELGYLRWWGRHHFMLMRYHLSGVLNELIRRSGVPELAYATVEEMEAFFVGEAVDFDSISERKHGHVTYLENGYAKIAVGEVAREFRAMVHDESIEDGIVRGDVACRGSARGLARVIDFGARDYDNQVREFRSGEILVTGMTRPQIAHLCRRAAAIVTDEGGITSHAAVISREFGIPCVIATHLATKTFRTGDAILVDAIQGVVMRV